MSKELALAIVRKTFPTFKVLSTSKSYRLGNYVLTVHQYRDVEAKRVVAIPIVELMGQILTDYTEAVTKVVAVEYTKKYDLGYQIMEEFKTLVHKRNILINVLNKAKDLPSLFNASFLTEFCVVYLSTSGNILTTKPVNNELFLDINQEEFLTFKGYLEGTGIEVKLVSKEEEDKEGVLFVEG